MQPIKAMGKTNAGGGGLVFRIDSATYFDYVLDPANAEASWDIANTRLLYAQNPPTSYEWVSLGATVADYQVVIAVVSGAFSTGAAGTYGLNVGVFLAVEQLSIGTETVTFTARIQRISDSAWMTGLETITLEATVDA